MRSRFEYERRPHPAVFLMSFLFLAGLLVFAEPAQAQARVIPTLDCIEVETRIVDGSQGPTPNTFVTAHLGYASEFTTPVTIPVSGDNFFSPGTPVRGQPETFQTGRNDRVFEVEFNQTRIPTLTWFLSAENVPSGGPSNPLRITDDPNVYCTPQSPVIIDPESLDFGEMLVGEVSEIESVTVQNNVAADLSVDRVDVIGRNVSSFRKSGDDCSGEVLAFSESCELRMRFVPTDEGPASATLRVTSNAYDSPTRVSLSGTGTVAPAPAIESIDPEQGIRGETLPVTINGSGFADGARATLAGEVRLRASSTSLEPSGDLTATFSIPNNMPEGTYGIEVRNPDGQEASLADAFEVTGGGGGGGGNGDDGGDNGTDPPPAADPDDTTTTLNVSSRWVNLGQSVTLSARLTDESGSALSGKRVILERRFVNQQRFQRIGVRTTNNTGRFAARVSAPRNAVFRARFAGDEENQASQRAVRVNVRAAVNLNLSRDSAIPGQRVVVSGNVRPAKTSFVNLTIRRGGEVVLNRRVNLNEQSRYRFVYRVPFRAASGNHVVRVRYAGDRQNIAGATSERFRVTTVQQLREQLLRQGLR